ncbi:bifunctional DNA primase/polymerase [Streptomyces sp. NPDC060194]|uniref:bifunctional DNA primase/polymerase n=1 Tax=Streptomyces sp. NPDC060194 TaxID=3347069 RepID=UPI0036686CCB
MATTHRHDRQDRPSPRDRRASTLALAHALTAAERGLAVIPLSRTKLPALPSPHRAEDDPHACRGACGRPGHGVHDATTDPARVRALFAAAPWATGYGIACGLPPHHLIGVDLDTDAHGPRDDGSGEGADSSAELRRIALTHLFSIPPTVVVITPSGGRHVWLSGPPDTAVPNSAGRLAPGVDVRGAGGYLVGPGSVTHAGVYRLAPGTADLPPAPCPPALLRLLAPAAPRRTGPRPATAASQGGGLVEFVRSAHEGQRNTRLFWAACRAQENGLGETLTEPLVAAARHTGLSDREARATLASAARFTTRTNTP